MREAHVVAAGWQIRKRHPTWQLRYGEIPDNSPTQPCRTAQVSLPAQCWSCGVPRYIVAPQWTDP